MAAEHSTKIWGIAIAGAVMIIAFLTVTSIGHVIDMAVQHFMLFYAGVFALIGLCASVGAGLIATDRMVLNPGHRVWIQAAHRAISFGAVAFLIVHIVTEILAQRVHVIDAVVPFMSPFRTFYIGLGTIASDLVILLVITGILRKRFTSNGKNVWRWRAIHYTSYAAFVFGVWHGLLGGRPGKPYVDWSYGFVVAFVGLGLAVRILAKSLRPRESLSAPPVAQSAGSGSAPLRAAAMLAQVGALRAAAPAPMTALGETRTMLPAAGAASGPMRVIPALPAGSGLDGTMFQGAPVYEPGYEGPPRYQGAPRPMTGPMPVVPDSAISGPLPQVQGPPDGGFSDPRTDPTLRVPGAPSGGFARPGTGSMRRVPGPPSGGFGRPATGPMPQPPGGMGGAMRGAWQRPMTQPMTGPIAGYGDAPQRDPEPQWYAQPQWDAQAQWDTHDQWDTQWDAPGQDERYGFPGGDDLR